MDAVELATSTGVDHVDQILRGIVGLYETVFPDRVRAYYLFGSYTNGTAVAISDIDMGVLFKGAFVDEQEALKAHQLTQHCSRISSIRLDIGVAPEQHFPVEHIQLKLASVLIYGEDTRDNIPLPKIDAYVGYITAWPNQFLTVLHRPHPLVFPLTYPDPHSEFFGYERKRIDSWYPASVEAGTKEFVACLCWAATAILGWKAGQFVGKKADSVRAYREFIGDDYAIFLERLYTSCVHHWGYHVPEKERDRLLLSELCAQALAFENQYLLVYREFLLAQLHAESDEQKLFGVRRLGEIIYRDTEVADALGILATGATLDIQIAAHETLQTMRQVLKQ